MAGIIQVKRYAEPAAVSSGRLLLCGTGTEQPGERRVLRDGERAKPESAPGDETRLIPGIALPTDDAAPDHLCGEEQRPERRRELQIAGRCGAQKVEVLDLGAVPAEVYEAHRSPIA